MIAWMARVFKLGQKIKEGPKRMEELRRMLETERSTEIVLEPFLLDLLREQPGALEHHLTLAVSAFLDKYAGRKPPIGHWEPGAGCTSFKWHAPTGLHNRVLALGCELGPGIRQAIREHLTRLKVPLKPPIRIPDKLLPERMESVSVTLPDYVVERIGCAGLRRRPTTEAALIEWCQAGCPPPPPQKTIIRWLPENHYLTSFGIKIPERIYNKIGCDRLHRGAVTAVDYYLTKYETEVKDNADVVERENCS